MKAQSKSFLYWCFGFVLALCFISFSLSAQTQQIDSLYQRLTSDIEDTARVNSLNYLSKLLLKEDKIEDAQKKAQEALNLSEQIDYAEGKGFANRRMAEVLEKTGGFSDAISYYTASLQFFKSINKKSEIAQSYSNLGITYGNQTKNSESLENHFNALKLFEELNDEVGICNTLNNIGVIYSAQGEFEKALEKQNNALEMRENMGDSSGLAASYNNIGIIYARQGEFKEAIENFNKSLKIRKEINDINGIAGSHSNIGLVYSMQGNYKKALDNSFAALEIIERANDKLLEVNAYVNIGELYLKINQLDKAEQYLSKALIIAEKTGSHNAIGMTYDFLSQLNIARSNYKKALEYYKTYISYRDSISNEETTKKIFKTEMKYQIDKQMISDSIEYAKESEIKNVKLREQEKVIVQKRRVQYFLFGGLFLVIVFAILMYNRFKVTHRQKGIIEEQKTIVEIKQKEILDSINYAKRIQKAILPSIGLMKTYLPNSFVFYKPKDIVAGDFYWLEKKDNLVLFAAADCTGHGVPGAMVSVICNNGLNRSVREYGITDPAKILEKTREIVIHEFEKSDDNVTDGMDISLCAYDTKSNKIYWAGANNSLWIFRKDTNLSSRVEEIKPNKQAIGQVDNPKPYKTHIVDINKGDTVYVFTDGYPDQFGGPSGKKLKYKPFKELLTSIQHLTMEEQKAHLYQHFKSWKGDLEQVDDVCVIGVRL